MKHKGGIKKMNNDSALSRRRFIQVSGAGVLGMEFLKSGGNLFDYTRSVRAADVTSPMTSDEALKELTDG